MGGFAASLLPPRTVEMKALRHAGDWIDMATEELKNGNHARALECLRQTNNDIWSVITRLEKEAEK